MAKNIDKTNKDYLETSFGKAFISFCLTTENTIPVHSYIFYNKKNNDDNNNISVKKKK